MAWRDKLETTANCLIDKPELAIVFTNAEGAPEQFIERLKEQYPFVNDEYLDFLRMTDGAQLDMFVFYGSGHSDFQPISKLVERWRDALGSGQRLPIGTDAAGSCIVIEPKGQVLLLGIDPPDPTDTRMLAESFDEFLDDILMGRRFPEMFGDEWNDEQENEWTDHLRSQGWM